MLTWKQPLRGKANYQAELVHSDPINIRAALVEAWIKFLDGLDMLAPDRWSIVLAYIEADSGAVTLYPTTREQPSEGIEELSVMLTIYDWAASYEKVSSLLHESANEAEPDGQSDEEFERAYNALLKMMARSVKNAVADPALADRFAALAKRPGFAIYYVDQGEMVHTANLIYLWGQRPPEGFPAATPLELFTGLVYKAQGYPGNCLKVDDDQVIEATFFGHEYTDKYVEILESVPNVSELCESLRVLTLQSTKIKPAGVERLKAMFPNTDVRIQ